MVVMAVLGLGSPSACSTGAKSATALRLLRILQHGLVSSPGICEQLTLPPLASAVAAVAGPTASVHLGRCARSLRCLVPTSLRGAQLRHWVSLHWPRIQGTPVLPSGPGLPSQGDVSVLLDDVFIIMAQAPETLLEYDIRGLLPLHVAARRRCPRLLRLLLEAQVPVDSVAEADGRTALHYAAAAADAACTRLLLEARADPHMRDSRRRLPLEFATRVSASDVQDLLLHRMAGGQPTTCAGAMGCQML
mmetsp:Transcript_19559/g.42775  ORF Transcript_19559/g.42775 Transcript_19559/m.42775 type:complete len:248 (+) Transcript_19559:94-837(+)